LRGDSVRVDLLFKGGALLGSYPSIDTALPQARLARDDGQDVCLVLYIGERIADLMIFFAAHEPVDSEELREWMRARFERSA
jgi:hypothetical protein